MVLQPQHVTPASHTSLHPLAQHSDQVCTSAATHTMLQLPVSCYSHLHLVVTVSTIPLLAPSSNCLCHDAAACTLLWPSCHATATHTHFCCLPGLWPPIPLILSLLSHQPDRGCAAPLPVLPGPRLILSSSSLWSRFTCASTLLSSLLSHSPSFLWPLGVYLQ